MCCIALTCHLTLLNANRDGFASYRGPVGKGDSRIACPGIFFLQTERVGPQTIGSQQYFLQSGPSRAEYIAFRMTFIV